jgi:hypothetical protein
VHTLKRTLQPAAPSLFGTRFDLYGFSLRLLTRFVRDGLPPRLTHALPETVFLFDIHTLGYKRLSSTANTRFTVRSFPQDQAHASLSTVFLFALHTL